MFLDFTVTLPYTRNTVRPQLIDSGLILVCTGWSVARDSREFAFSRVSNTSAERVYIDRIHFNFCGSVRPTCSTVLTRLSARARETLVSCISRHHIACPKLTSHLEVLVTPFVVLRAPLKRHRRHQGSGGPRTRQICLHASRM